MQMSPEDTVCGQWLCVWSAFGWCKVQGSVSKKIRRNGACRRRLAGVGDGGIRRRGVIRAWALIRENGWFVVDLRVTYSKQT